MTDDPPKPPISRYSISRVFYPAGNYEHEPSGLVQLRLVRRGSSYAQIDLGAGRRTVFTRPGDLLLSLPERPTAFTIEDGRELTLLQIAPETAAACLAAAGGALSNLTALTERPFRDSLIAEVCRRLEEDDRRMPNLGEHAVPLVVSLLLIQARKKLSLTRHPTLSLRLLEQLKSSIDEGLGRPVTVDSLAELARMPKRQFSAAFRDATGLPVYQFVMRKRVDRARELLEHTDLSLAEIAQRTGFAHQAHMTTTLKRLTGRTPAQIRAPV